MTWEKQEAKKSQCSDRISSHLFPRA